MSLKNSTTTGSVSVSAVNVTIIQSYLDHLVDAAESLRKVDGLGAVADKVQMAAEQIGYYFDPQFADHRGDTDRWIKRLEKAAHENFSRLAQADA